jgi:hypothetical protein
MSSHGPQVYERFFHDEGKGSRGEDEPEAASYQHVTALQGGCWSEVLVADRRDGQ